MKQKKASIILISLTVFLLTNGCIKANREKHLEREIKYNPVINIANPSPISPFLNPLENIIISNTENDETKKEVSNEAENEAKKEIKKEVKEETVKKIDKTKALYERLSLENKLDYRIFKMAINGLEIINPPLRNYLAIVDFTKDSTKKRFFLIDLVNETLVYHDFVAHGRNTGDKEARNFSNIQDSNKSSLGFYLTAESYYGSNGYSLRLDGLDKGLNDRARQRAIVLHGAPYVSEKFIAQTGRLGRSLGCPAVSPKITRDVINRLKGGNLIFHYAKGYENESYILKNKHIL